MKSHSGTERKLKNESKVIFVSQPFHQDAPVFITRFVTASGFPRRRLQRRLTWHTASKSYPLKFVNLVRNLATVTGSAPGRRRRFLLFWENRPSYLTPAGSWVSLKDGSLAGNRISSRFRRGANRKWRDNKSRKLKRISFYSRKRRHN